VIDFPERRVARASGFQLSDNTDMAQRVLLVEDDERLRASLRLVLEDQDFEVEEADSGEEALEVHERALSSKRFDLLVLDVMLPGMDGLECCRQIRLNSTVPIVLATARTETEDVVAGLAAGADDYLTKPYEPADLVARIRALLANRSPLGAPRDGAPGDLPAG
jgi:DNA-binding response OmpR family regulator